ncbi:MAG: LysM peptidoglycan-binding domain-containing protein [Muribaculaceae bacterium]|nr:LysM peptidoglycan-binding domain-containing protein [Muribaculaceae bacterium]
MGFQKNISIGLKLSLAGCLMTIAWTTSAESTSKLPTTEILGKEYYIYIVKKGESVYGIAKKNGWDLEELLRLNPEASGKIEKGERLYYPTGQVSVVTEMPEPVAIDYSSLEPIRHKVKKGETVYSISRQYNIPLDIIYKYNPEAKRGVKPGETIEMPQNGNAQYYYYTLKSGDSLSALAKAYNTSVEDILKDNAGLTANNLPTGETIRISINSNLGKIKTELVTEERVSQISDYKVEKNDTWENISEKTGVEVEVLKEANNETEKPKEHTIVTVPVIETVEVEQTVAFEEPEDMTVEDVQEIYDSIKGVTPDRSLIDGVKMALILDEPSSKKDVDFTRGLLIGISDFKNASYKIDLKVMDGRVSTGDLIEGLEDYEPNLIISTADRAFPLFLADYGNTNNVQIVNVFDLKNDLYEDNSSMVQLLPPSGYFNDRLSTKIYKDNRNRKLIAVGEEDENDGMSTELFKLFDNVDKISLEDFGALEPDVLEPILIYTYASKKEEVADFFKNVENLAENNQELDFRIIGRSSWIAMTDDFGDQFEEYSVYVPSRVWLEENSKAWENFNISYDEIFGGNPVRSIPNFAASGYDVAKYFIPLVAMNHGDFNHGLKNYAESSLQNEIDLSRVNNWGGFINNTSYLIKFRPGNQTEGIIVK